METSTVAYRPYPRPLAESRNMIRISGENRRSRTCRQQHDAQQSQNIVSAKSSSKNMHINWNLMGEWIHYLCYILSLTFWMECELKISIFVPKQMHNFFGRHFRRHVLNVCYLWTQWLSVTMILKFIIIPTWRCYLPDNIGLRHNKNLEG